MDPLITFEGNTEYLVVDSALSQSLVTLAPLPSCDTHNLTDGLVIAKHKQLEATSPAIACSASASLPAVVEVRREQGQQQLLTRVPANTQTIAGAQQQPPTTYRFDAVASTAADMGTVSGLCTSTTVTAQMVIEGPAAACSSQGDVSMKSSVTSSMHNYSSRMADTNNSTDRSNSAQVGSSDERFHCYQCKLQFVSEHKAVAHFRSAHSRITCHHCRLLKFDSYGAYGRHVKELHVQCELCHALVKHRTALQKHLSRYHPDRSDRFRITCGEVDCTSQFISLADLTIHLKVIIYEVFGYLYGTAVVLYNSYPFMLTK